MGVPKFYRWISERYPCLSEVLKEYQVCAESDIHLFLNDQDCVMYIPTFIRHNIEGMNCKSAQV